MYIEETIIKKYARKLFHFLVSLKEFEERKPKIVSLLKSRQHWVAVNKSKQFKKNIGLIKKYR